MLRLLVGVALAMLAACNKAPDGGGGAGPTATEAPSLAFVYDYTFRLPSARIADAQERHAQACEQLGAPRCRITAMTYNVDANGEAQASLGMALAAPIARRFGRDGVKAIEAAGGALTGADISGTDTAHDTATGDAVRSTGADEVARIDRALARSNLTPPERAELLRQRAAAVATRNEGSAQAATARASIATTPVSFTYRAGSGVGVLARLADAWALLQWSFVGTMSALLTIVAVLGPAMLLLLLMLLAWHHWLRHGWARLWRDRAPLPD